MISICIPKIEYTIEESYIRNVFRLAKIGKINRYTELRLKNDKHHKRILMNIEWNKENAYLCEILKNGRCIQLVHKFPEVWKIYLAKN